MMNDFTNKKSEEIFSREEQEAIRRKIEDEANFNSYRFDPETVNYRM